MPIPPFVLWRGLSQFGRESPSRSLCDSLGKNAQLYGVGKNAQLYGACRSEEAGSAHALNATEIDGLFVAQAREVLDCAGKPSELGQSQTATIVRSRQD